jgi:4-amino-4-deoxy-L-arabinose transferase-like glycosyltransferase
VTSKPVSWGIIAIIIISFLIRIYRLNNLSLFGDEIDVGYQAFSLSQTGRDYKGNFLPFYLQSLAESRAPLLIYTVVPFVSLFGLNQVGVRLAPVLFGVLSIYLIYKLVLSMSQSKPLSLASAAVLSLMPWHFHYSRAAFEVTLLISLILAGTYFFYLFINNTKNKFLYLSILFFGLSFYTYNTANIFVPLLVIFLILTNLKTIIHRLKPSLIFTALILTLVLTFPLVKEIFYGQAAARFSSLSIINNPKVIDQIVVKRTDFSATNPNIEAIFHHKPGKYLTEISKNYIKSFSLDFLFLTGDFLNVRHSIPNFGQIFIIFLPFLLFGLFKMSPKKPLDKLMLFWLIISPIPSSLTLGGGTHATRLFLMVVPLAYFIAFGIIKIPVAKSRLVYSFMIICLSLQIISFAHEYFVHYPKNSFENWNYGYDQIFKNIPSISNHLYISNAKYNSLLPYLFYQKYSPQNFIADKVVDNGPQFNLNSQTTFINQWSSIDHLEDVKAKAKSHDIFVLFQEKDVPGDMDFSQQPLAGFTTIKTIYNPNHTILAQIIQKL